MKQAQKKDFFREIRKSLNRYLSILFIVALGVAFYAGIRSAEPDMQQSADTYFDQARLMDIRVLGTMGISDADVEAIRAVEGVTAAEGGYNADFLTESGDITYTLSVLSLCREMNQMTVMEGRLPETAGECFLDQALLEEMGLSVGDELTLQSGTEDPLEDILTGDTYTITGSGTYAWFLNLDRGTTTIGDGDVDGFAIVLPEAFDLEYYTVAYARAEGLAGENCYSDEYEAQIEAITDRLEAIADGRCEAHFASIRGKAQEKIDEGAQELRDAQEEAEEKLADAAREIEDARKELEDGKEKLADAQVQLEDGKKELADGQRQLQDARQTLAEKTQELQDAKAELPEAEQKLADARKELEDGREEFAAGVVRWEEGREEADRGWHSYHSGVGQLEDAEEQLREQEEVMRQGEEELKKQEAALVEQEGVLKQSAAQLEEQEKPLLQAEEQLAQAERLLTEKQTELDGQRGTLEENLEELRIREQALEEQQQQLDAWRKELEAGGVDPETNEEFQKQRSALDAGREEIAKNQEILTAAQAELDAGQAALDEEKERLAAGQAETAQNRLKLDAAKEQLADGQKQLEDGRLQLEAAKKELAQGRLQLEAGWEEVDRNWEKLEDARAQLDAAEEELAASWTSIGVAANTLEQGERELEDGERQLEDAKVQIADGERQLQEGGEEIARNEQRLLEAQQELPEAEEKIAQARIDIAEGEQQLADGQKEYEDGKREADEKIQDARRELEDAQKELDDLEPPEWYVLDRGSIQSYVEFGMDAERIGAIGKVFPAIFFLVAALVSLTTMTRMVEEERTLIGTMKALGYGKWGIASKYLLYALSASLFGSVLGVAVGSQLLPWVIMTAYAMLYTNLQLILTPVNLPLALMATGIAVACTAAAALGACYKELRSTPAQLMRPAAPVQGKRVLLEYLPFIWKRMTFTGKSTIRNLFRYKKRFLMTIFGIGACMALLMVGFGLRDSIQDIVDNQYRTLWIYDTELSVDEDLTPRQQAAEADRLKEAFPEITETMFARVTALDVGKDNVEKSAYIFVPQSTQELDRFVVLKDRLTDVRYSLTDEGVVISEKLSRLLDVQVGDEIYLKEGETDRYPVTVQAISENYLSHYVYLTPALYEKLYGEPPVYNQLYLNLSGVSELTMEEENAMTERFLKEEMVEAVQFAGGLQRTVQDMLKSLDMVIWVLIVAAGLLAFVVLYNLNNINITERRRELATLKVLGFYDNEVAAYVYRENIYLTVIGIGCGIVLGILLHRYVILACEIDMMMFGRNIRPMSYVYSILITIFFSVFVNITMFYRLRKIDMVESLKSVE